MIVYPTKNYDSYINEDDADTYFESRLNVDEWNACSFKEAALQTTFRSLAELDLSIEFDSDKLISDTYYTTTQQAEILADLQIGQCEQALHELQNDLDFPQAVALGLSGLSIKMPDEKPQRFSPRAMAVLKQYVKAPTISRTR